MTQSDDGWVDAARARSLQQLEGIARMQQELSTVSGTAEAAQGRVRVRVTPAGMPTELHLTDSAMQLSAAELADQIMEAIAGATATAAAQMRAIVGQVVPEEQLDAIMRGAVSETDVRDVREQIDALREGR